MYLLSDLQATCRLVGLSFSVRRHADSQSRTETERRAGAPHSKNQNDSIQTNRISSKTLQYRYICRLRRRLDEADHGNFKTTQLTRSPNDR